ELALELRGPFQGEVIRFSQLADLFGDTHYAGSLAELSAETQAGRTLHQFRRYEIFRRLELRAPLAILRVLEHLAFEIADDHPTAMPAEDVFRVDRHLAAAARRVDDVLRHGVTCRVPAQRLHDFQPLAHRRAQVSRAGDEVALVHVVWLHPAQKKLLHERLHHGHVVIDMLEEHGLVAQRNTRIRQAAERVAHLGGQLAWVVGVDADEERMKLSQHRAQLRSDALREKDRNAGPDAKELDVPNRPQPAEKIFQLLVAEQQRVAAAQQHVPHFGMLFDVSKLFVEVRMKVVSAGVAHQARA